MRNAAGPAIALAAVLLGPGASAMAANGSHAGTRVSAEYRDAVRRADKDYDEANRRCEVLAIDERNLCRRDSTLARRAAIAEARTKPPPGKSRADPTAR